jgi:hypothetical protein
LQASIAGDGTNRAPIALVAFTKANPYTHHPKPWEPETKANHETRDPEPGTLNHERETLNQKPETRNPEP